MVCFEYMCCVLMVCLMVCFERMCCVLQVISNALGVWGLEIILFNSREYQQLRIDSIHEKAFICNYKEHWFTVRKLGQQWFNLNSLLTGPELISDTYLALFLAQLQQEGYSIFVIRGSLPECEADQILRIMRVEQQQRPKLIGEDEAQRCTDRHHMTYRTRQESSPSSCAVGQFDPHSVTFTLMHLADSFILIDSQKRIKNSQNMK
uniref:ubiquitinyl hydrolase 1 n=1 Tax=Sinocyclocheilus grahami TaxID=75366 RepID=A0A672K0Y2_SINGR